MKTSKIVIAALTALALFGSAAQAGSPVNVNTATAAEIAAGLDGVGATKAEAIVAYRVANGPFADRDELVAVKGIGIATVDKNKAFILLKD